MPEINKLDAFNNIDYNNITKSVPVPDKITDIDVNNSFYSNIFEYADEGILDINKINSFTTISKSRDNVYELLDIMAEDPIVSAALNIYASDVSEMNDVGKVIWCESDDEKVNTTVAMILDSLNVDQNAFSWAYSLCKYGDLYLRLYRESDFEILDNYINNINKNKNTLNEDVIFRVFSKNDRYAGYTEAVLNPAEVFDLTKYGKSYGYLKTNIIPNATRHRDDIFMANTNNQFMYKFKSSDVEIFEATEFVHACLNNQAERYREEVTLINDTYSNLHEHDYNDSEENIDTSEMYTFSVKRGQSILYNSFKIWRELSLLENAVLLNRLTSSSVLRLVKIQIGDMEGSDARNVLQRTKAMMEQKTAINTNIGSYNEYTNPGPLINTIYIPVRGETGSIEVESVGGGETDAGDLNDLDYWRHKLATSLGIPGAYLGLTEDSTGFNGGTSLSIQSSRYAKTVKFIQNCLIQAITDAVNLNLYSRGLKNYINKFRIRMQAPTTQEELDRRDNLDRYVSSVSSIVSLVGEVSNEHRLRIIKSLLSNIISDPEVFAVLQEEIESSSGNSDGEGDDFGGDDFGGGDFGGDDFGGDDLPSPEDILGDTGEEESEPVDLTADENEAPQEAFGQNRSGRVLNEKNDLPSFAEMGISYETV